MENFIICPNCEKKILKDPTIDASDNSTRSVSGVITCDCGAKMTYFGHLTPTRKQKTPG
jgi:RNase P subunit RPR2